MLEIISPSSVSLIQSILILLSGIVILIASIGILTFKKDMPNVVYARIHVLGMIDVAGIVVFLALGQYLFAVLYLVLAPFLAHAMANAYFYGEDEYNALYAADMAVDDADDVEAAGGVHQMDECHLSLVEQQLLTEEVAAGISRQRQFWQTDDFRASSFGLDDERLNLLDVVLAVSHLHRRDGRSDFDKSVIHRMRIDD